MMARPGFILMAIIAVAVGVASFGAIGGGHDLFTPESATHEAEAAASALERG
jgi:hypothetical protein